jgi:hypothetical protein
MQRRNYTSVPASTTLNGAINSSVTSLVVTDATGFPAAPFTILVDSEVILVGAKSGTTFSTLTRGYDGTTAASHSDLATLAHVGIAEDVRLAWGKHDFVRRGDSNIYLFQSMDPGAGDNDVGANTRLHASPICIPSKFPLTGITVQVRTTAQVGGNNARLAIYANKDGRPDALVTSGTIDATSVGTKTVTISLSELEPGEYWGAVMNWGATTLPKYRGYSGTRPALPYIIHGGNLQAIKCGVYITLASDALPDPFGAPTDFTTTGHYFGLTSGS